MEAVLNRLVMYNAPSSIVAESFRSLRGSLIRSLEEGRNTILISSAWAKEGKSIVCTNLAVALAQVGKRTIIIDGDLRRPTVSRFFEVQDRQGLGELLESPDEMPSLPLVDVGLSGLSVLPAGRSRSSPPDLMAGPKIGRVLAAVSAKADCVLIDSPPLTFFAEGLRLASVCKGVVLVINPARWRGEEELNLKKSLEEAGAKLLGIVLNGSESDTVPSSYYYGYKSYRKE